MSIDRSAIAKAKNFYKLLRMARPLPEAYRRWENTFHKDHKLIYGKGRKYMPNFRYLNNDQFAFQTYISLKYPKRAIFTQDCLIAIHTKSLDFPLSEKKHFLEGETSWQKEIFITRYLMMMNAGSIIVSKMVNLQSPGMSLEPWLNLGFAPDT
jgi:hypothetical protein